MILHFSFPQQVHPVPLDVLPSPLSFCLQKQRLSKMILQIVAPLVASIGAAATLKQDLCVSPMAPSFSMACCRCNLSPGRNRISIAYGSDVELDLSQGLVREGECGFQHTTKPSPPHHQRENVCNVLAWPFSARRVSGEGKWRGSEGKTEMKFMVPMQFLSLVLGGSTDSSQAEPNLRCFLVTTMAERPW